MQKPPTSALGAAQAVKPGFTILEHPADLGIEARGEDIAAAFALAAEGLMTVLLDPAQILPRQEIAVHLRASDREHLLVRWLSELLYQVDGHGFAPKSFAVTLRGEAELTATIRGEPLDLERHATRTDVKAITYHQLSVRETPEGILLRVFLDI